MKINTAQSDARRIHGNERTPQLLLGRVQAHNDDRVGFQGCVRFAPAGRGLCLEPAGMLTVLPPSYNEIVFSFSETRNFGSVSFCTSSGVTPGATSRRTKPSGVTSMTASSVTIMSTTSAPVSGNVHFLRIFGFPSFV